jgi:hypothetical protein
MLEVLKSAPGTDPPGLIFPGKRRRRQEDYRDGDQAIRGRKLPYDAAMGSAKLREEVQAWQTAGYHRCL